jgi:hypothetical protein
LNIWTQIRSQFSLDVIIIVEGGISSLLTTLHVFVACPAASDVGYPKAWAISHNHASLGSPYAYYSLWRYFALVHFVARCYKGLKLLNPSCVLCEGLYLGTIGKDYLSSPLPEPYKFSATASSLFS